MTLTLPRLYAIIDAAQTEDSPAGVAGIILEAGVRLIQYRNKRASSRELYDGGREIAARIHQYNAMFVVNDRADVARAVNAHGVHVGQDDLPVELARKVLAPGKLIGYSTHLLAQVAEADRSSADYIAFGPVFPTRSKENPDPVVGLEGLSQARKLTRKPLVAIGGITVENAGDAIGAGADSVALIHGLLGAANLAERAREFLRLLSDV